MIVDGATILPLAGAYGEAVYVYEDIGYVCIAIGDFGENVIELEPSLVEPFIEAIRKAQGVATEE